MKTKSFKLLNCYGESFYSTELQDFIKHLKMYCKEGQEINLLKFLDKEILDNARRIIQRQDSQIIALTEDLKHIRTLKKPRSRKIKAFKIGEVGILRIRNGKLTFSGKVNASAKKLLKVMGLDIDNQITSLQFLIEDLKEKTGIKHIENMIQSVENFKGGKVGDQ